MNIDPDNIELDEAYFYITEMQNEPDNSIFR